MKKRLRKKLRIAEFREFGFEVRFQSDEKTFDQFIDMIESNNLQFGGGGLTHWEGFVDVGRRGSPSKEQRMAVRNWLLEHPDIDSVYVGDFVDIWN